MLRVHLLLFQGCALVDEFIIQLLPHLNHTRRLEFICVGFWCADCKSFSWLSILEEGVNGLLSLGWDEVELLQGSHLDKGCLLLIPGLLLQNSDGPTQSIDGFRVILVQDIVIVLFNSRTLVAALMSPSQMEMSSSSPAISFVSRAALAVYDWMSAFNVSICSLASAIARVFSTLVSSQNCL